MQTIHALVQGTRTRWETKISKIQEGKCFWRSKDLDLQTARLFFEDMGKKIRQRLLIFIVKKASMQENIVNLQRRKNQIGLRLLRLMEDNGACLEDNFPKYFLLQQVPRHSPSEKCFFCLFDQRSLWNAAGMCLFWWFSKADSIYFKILRICMAKKPHKFNF